MNFRSCHSRWRRRRNAVALAFAISGSPSAAGAEEACRPECKSNPSLAESLKDDAKSLLGFAKPSPVSLRAQRRRQALVERRTKRRGMKKSYAAFERTQRGPFDATIGREARRWGLDPFLVKGLLANESRLDPELTGKRIYTRVAGKRMAVGGGARGIAQFTYSGVEAVNEARQRRQFRGDRVRAFEQSQVWEPEVAIAAATELLSTFIARYGRDGGVTAYNTGPGGGAMVKKYGFHRARKSGRLSRHGVTRLQGHRFLINVLRHTNRFRKQAGLTPAPRPGRSGRSVSRRRRREPGS